MSCCKNNKCKNFNEQQLPVSELSARETLTAAREIVGKLLGLAHLNNKILPGDISPLRLANLIADLLRIGAAPAPTTATDNFVLKFGPNKAYELHLPATAPKTLVTDNQKMFDF